MAGFLVNEVLDEPTIRCPIFCGACVSDFRPQA